MSKNDRIKDMAYTITKGKARPLVNNSSLMQPFLPGSPGGRGFKNGRHDGKRKRVEDWRWRLAFPDCKHNRWLEEKE